MTWSLEREKSLDGSSNVSCWFAMMCSDPVYRSNCVKVVMPYAANGSRKGQAARLDIEE